MFETSLFTDYPTSFPLTIDICYWSDRRFTKSNKMNIKLNMLYKMRWLFACLALVSVASCQKALDINVDPNKALNASPNLVLPAAQVEMGLTVGNTWNFVGSMWAQYWTGGHGVSSSGLEYYTMQSVDVQSAWTRSYERCLQDLNYLIKSDEPIYAGMAKICTA